MSTSCDTLYHNKPPDYSFELEGKLYISKYFYLYIVCGGLLENSAHANSFLNDTREGLE